MRFYKNRQWEMLHYTAMLLKTEQNNVSSKVPALKEFITGYLEKVDKMKAMLNWNPNAIMRETLGKRSVKEAFAEVTMKLLAVVKAANYRNSRKQAEEIKYTLWGLKKLSAADLCKVYLSADAKVKRIKNISYYGLSPGDLRDAQTYYKEFAVLKNAPAKRKKDVAAKNKRLDDGITACIDMLEHTIDPLMMMATEGNLQLRMRYKDTRKVLARSPGRPSDAEAAYRKSREAKKKS